MGYAILLDRGNCSNVEKARNVEDFGGSIALIVDNEDENTEDLLMTDQTGDG